MSISEELIKIAVRLKSTKWLSATQFLSVSSTFGAPTVFEIAAAKKMPHAKFRLTYADNQWGYEIQVKEILRNELKSLLYINSHFRHAIRVYESGKYLGKFYSHMVRFIPEEAFPEVDIDDVDEDELSSLPLTLHVLNKLDMSKVELRLVPE